jgi:hypothetical protein
MFYVGQEVICVNANDANGCVGWHKGSAPIEGRVYTVRAIGITILGNFGIKLNEIILNGNNSGIFFKDFFYRADRFRPIQKKKNDISMLTALLNTKSIKELV